MDLYLHNSLSDQKEKFEPLDPSNVRMYVCGPTVYNRPHIGNARAVVVYDVLYRLLKKLYPKVTYVRNITDVDDKINAQAKENGEEISALATRVTKWFHEDMAALNNVDPDVEPKATEHIDDIISMIERLIENGHAYENQSHVLFDVGSVGQMGDYHYGKLSGKKLEDLIAGARVDVESYKNNPGDFVLWKPSNDDEPGWDSPWGFGRPGWHIECSAMSTKYLGQDFDIHGGGADLKFPHHENEIAQSCCSNKQSIFANYWIHNGFLTVNGAKMAKSEGNFITVDELLKKGVKGEIIRYVLLATHYRKPLDFSDKSLDDAKKALDKFYTETKDVEDGDLSEEFISCLADDVNTPKAIALLHNSDSKESLKAGAKFLGLLQESYDQWFDDGKDLDIDEAEIERLINLRYKAKENKDWSEADRIRDELAAKDIILEDGPSGTTWKKA